ncbi:hypothetical protein AVEN_154474-1 [Araneus ventricosus]|uniref:Uncharacterized protein n=1 Tax=Araneus ventricosus TaxID=182803 RepID=A0A4Y2R006_ARAVE|nr:hypothetical protein AVEN_154474-1 [Araneus ventricosus]
MILEMGSELLLRKRKPPVGQGAGSCSEGGRRSRRELRRPVVGFGDFVNDPPKWMNSNLEPSLAKRSKFTEALPS